MKNIVKTSQNQKLVMPCKAMMHWAVYRAADDLAFLLAYNEEIKCLYMYN